MSKTMKTSISVFFLFLCSIAGPALAQEPISVTPDDLVISYDDNELAADLKYKGKMVEINGQISTIASSHDGRPYVALRGRSSDRYYGSVWCIFTEEQINDLLTLKKGQDFRATCKVSGKDRTMSVELIDCTIK